MYPKKELTLVDCQTSPNLIRPSGQYMSESSLTTLEINALILGRSKPVSCYRQHAEIHLDMSLDEPREPRYERKVDTAVGVRK